MNRYRAYGLTIASAIALPELACAADTADVHVSWEEAAAPAADRYELDFAPDVIRLANGMLELSAHGGTMLRVKSHDLSLPAVRQYVVGPGLAMLLLQRGVTLLHASAVAMNGSAVCFSAEAGGGKSTMAAALYRSGGTLLTDDLCAIHSAHVLPAFPLVKLSDASRDALGPPGPLIDVEVEGEGRSRFAVSGFADAAVPLRAIVILATGEKVALDRLRGSAAFFAVLRNLFWFELAGGELATRLFREAEKLASTVPVFQLTRPRDLGLLNSAVETVRPVYNPHISLAAERGS